MSVLERLPIPLTLSSNLNWEKSRYYKKDLNFPVIRDTRECCISFFKKLSGSQKVLLSSSLNPKMKEHFSSTTSGKTVMDAKLGNMLKKSCYYCYNFRIMQEELTSVFYGASFHFKL